MKQRELDSMSIGELWMLHERIAATLTAKINAEKKALIDRLKQADMSVHQLRANPGVSLWFAGQYRSGRLPHLLHFILAPSWSSVMALSILLLNLNTPIRWIIYLWAAAAAALSLLQPLRFSLGNRHGARGGV